MSHFNYIFKTLLYICVLNHIYSLTDYCGLGRELCQWKVDDGDTTWQTVSQEQTKNWNKRFISALTDKDKSYQGTVIEAKKRK